MNFKTYALNLAIKLLLVLSLGLTFSCQKDADGMDGNSRIKINMMGLDNSGQVATKIASSSKAKTLNQSQIFEQPFDDKYILETVLSPVGSQRTSTNNFNQSNGNPALKAVGIEKVTPLKSGTEYTVAVYTKAGAYVLHQEYTYTNDMVAPELNLAQGEYIFYALASGSNELPAINFNKPLEEVKLESLTAHMDLMYFSAPVTIGAAASHAVNVKLTHKFTRLTLILNTAAVTTINSIGSMCLSPSFPAVDIALKTGEANYGSASSGCKAMSLKTPLPTKILRSDSVLILSNSSSTGNLSISNIQVGLTTKNLTIPNLSLLEGVDYIMTVTLKLKSGTGIDIGGDYLWAPGNLLDSMGKYKFADNQGLTGDYWQLNSLKTNDGGKQLYDIATDPCAQVTSHGAGWRTPSRDEILSVTGDNNAAFNEINFPSTEPAGARATYPGGDHKGLYMGTTTQPSDADKDKYLFLPMAGNNGASIGTQGVYWTTTPEGEVNNFFFQFAEWNITFPISHSNFRQRYSIRCVKNK